MTIKYPKCKFPDCDGSASEPRNAGLCRKHAEMLRFFLWAMDNVKFKDKKETKSGLILP